MATAISQANFETAIGEVFDAIENENWSEAWKEHAKATAQHVGLMAEANDSDGNSYKRQDTLEQLANAITMAEAAIERRGTRSRFVRGKTGFAKRKRDPLWPP